MTIQGYRDARKERSHGKQIVSMAQSQIVKRSFTAAQQAHAQKISLVMAADCQLEILHQCHLQQAKRSI